MLIRNLKQPISAPGRNIKSGSVAIDTNSCQPKLQSRLGFAMARTALLGTACLLLALAPSSGQAQYSLSQNIYIIGSNPAGLALDPVGNNIGGVPSISWIFNAPVAGPATLSILAEGVDGGTNAPGGGEHDAVFFNGNLLGNLTQQSFYSSAYNLQPGPGALPGITAETTSFFTVLANAGLNTVIVNVDPNRWVNEVEVSTLVSVPEPGAFALGTLALMGLQVSRRLGRKS